MKPFNATQAMMNAKAEHWTKQLETRKAQGLARMGGPSRSQESEQSTARQTHSSLHSCPLLLHIYICMEVTSQLSIDHDPHHVMVCITSITVIINIKSLSPLLPHTNSPHKPMTCALNTSPFPHLPLHNIKEITSEK